MAAGASVVGAGLYGGATGAEAVGDDPLLYDTDGTMMLFSDAGQSPQDVEAVKGG